MNKYNIYLPTIIISLFLFLLFTITQAQAETLPSNTKGLSSMLKKVMPAVVNIYAEGDNKSAQNPFPDEDPGTKKQRNTKRHFTSIGSGVIVDAKHGLILTNTHVVYDTDNITVTLNDGRRFKARPIGADAGFDIALLKIPADNLTAIPLGNSSTLRIGDFVTAIGSPFNLRQTVTSGIVSALHRSIHLEGYEDFIQTDAAINIGSSGGALVNLKGQLVGLNTAILAPDGGNIGIGFAIPINLAKKVMRQLLKYGKINRGLLGILIQNLTPDLATNFNAPKAKGALISQVNKGSPAAMAGIKEGDIINGVNNTHVANAAEVRNYIALLRPGATVALSILRDGKPLSINAKVVTEKAYKEQIANENKSLLAGVSMENFDQQTLTAGHIKGVEVDYIDQNSDAWSAMLRPGDVIVSADHKQINNIKDLENVMKNEKSHKVLLRVLRNNGALYLLIP